MDPTQPMPSPPPSEQNRPDPALLSGRYRLGDLVGRGGMAEVYRARDERLGRDVAVKLFRADSGIPLQGLRHRSEVHILAGLSHPGVVAVLDAAGDGPESARPFLVMELIEGASLAQRLRHGPLPPRQVAEIGAQLAAALSYVHGKGVIHRDIKPANVLLGDPPAGHHDSVAVKLSDFGIARLLEEARITTDGTIGTPNYLSPEQVTGADVGPASDVYALGLVLLECLTGNTAYPGHGIAAATARLHRPPVIPGSLGPAWTGLLAAMTSLPAQTRPTAEQARSALRRLAGDPSPAAAATRINPMPIPTQPTTGPVGHPTRRRLLLIAPLVIAAVVIAAIVLRDKAGGRRTPAAAPPSASNPTTTPQRTRPSQTSPTTPSATTPSRSTAPSSAAPPATATQALAKLRAAIARTVTGGGLDPAAATDLEKRLDEIGHSLSGPAGPGPGRAADAGHKVADLAHHLSDLEKSGRLTAVGQRRLTVFLASLERFVPPRH